jgi:HK97 family phage prohead protease
MHRAFEDGFKQRLPVMCWQHDLRDPIGRAIDAQVLPKTNELRAQFDDFDVVPNAARAYHQLRSGTLTDFSFGFKNARILPPTRRGGVRRVASAFMAEMSPVTIGSIPGAKMTGIREDGSMDQEPEFELGQIIHLRDSGILTVEGAELLIRRDYPEVADHVIMVRDTADTNGGTGEDDDTNAVPGWTASDAGLHTATGPNDEAMTVMPSGDGHVWAVIDTNGDPLGSGKADSAEDAKDAATRSVVSQRSDVVDIFADYEGEIDATMLRTAIEAVSPRVAELMQGQDLVLSVRGSDVIGTGTQDGGMDHTTAASLVAAVDAAIDSGIQWLDGVDIASLPDPVQQALALFQAASTSVDALMDEMNIDDPDDTDDGADGGGDDDDDGDLAIALLTGDGGDGGDSHSLGPRADEELEHRAADMGWSTKPWAPKKGDYSDDQWKSACLIDDSLPVKEPDGTYNVNGIAAAAGRLGQTDASDADKKAAAHTLMGLYGKMKKPVPPTVLKIAGDGTRSDDEVVIDHAEVEAAERRLRQMVGSRT